VETIDDFAEQLISLGLATPDTIVPCSPDEVAEVLEAQHLDQLPEQYERFLLTMGRQAGELLRGTTVFYPAIVELVDEMCELVQDNNVTHLVKAGSVLAGMHQGYQLYWIEPGQPSGPVRMYVEGEKSVHESWPTWLDFLGTELERHQSIARKLGR
jgi:hypothetical protein